LEGTEVKYSGPKKGCSSKGEREPDRKEASEGEYGELPTFSKRRDSALMDGGLQEYPVRRSNETRKEGLKEDSAARTISVLLSNGRVDGTR